MFHQVESHREDRAPRRVQQELVPCSSPSRLDARNIRSPHRAEQEKSGKRSRSSIRSAQTHRLAGEPLCGDRPCEAAIRLYSRAVLATPHRARRCARTNSILFWLPGTASWKMSRSLGYATGGCADSEPRHRPCNFPLRDSRRSNGPDAVETLLTAFQNGQRGIAWSKLPSEDEGLAVAIRAQALGDERD